MTLSGFAVKPDAAYAHGDARFTARIDSKADMTLDFELNYFGPDGHLDTGSIECMSAPYRVSIYSFHDMPRAPHPERTLADPENMAWFSKASHPPRIFYAPIDSIFSRACQRFFGR